MKVAVRYQSRGGNTKKVADYIAKSIGVEAESISAPINDFKDLLIIGGGVYAWKLDKELVEYLEHLDNTLVGKVAAFTTAGGMDKTNDILETVKGKGIEVSKFSLPIKFLLKGHQALGQAGKAELSEKQRLELDKFVRENISE